MKNFRDLMLIGALQGVALTWLWKAHEHHWWPATDAIVLGVFLWFFLSFPFALYLTAATPLQGKSRYLSCLGGGLFYAAIGAYAGWVEQPLHVLEKISPPGSFAQVLGAIILAFIAVPLVTTWQNKAEKWHYPDLFSMAWRNALLCAAVAVITGIFWGVMITGAHMLEALGVKFFVELIEEPVFFIPVTGVAVGAIASMALARYQWLESLRKFWLGLNAWLLPLAMFFGVAWAISVPLNGFETFLETKDAAFILLWFTVLAVKFVNAGWQDGVDDNPYPRWLSVLLEWSWLSMLMVSGVAFWALSLRVFQYGWTQDRLWALFITIIALCFSFGYAVSLIKIKQRGWFWSLPTANIATALFAIIALSVLISPIGDPRRIAVNSQLARLLNEEVSPKEFDFEYLRWGSGKWGQEALQTLATRQESERDKDIASYASTLLKQKNRYEDYAQADDEMISRRFTLLDASQTIPENFFTFAASKKADWALQQCVNPKRDCMLWLHDLDADDSPEILVFEERSNLKYSEIRVYTKQNEQWQWAASYNGKLNPSEFASALKEGRFTLVTPRWPNIKTEKGELSVSVKEANALP